MQKSAKKATFTA